MKRPSFLLVFSLATCLPIVFLVVMLWVGLIGLESTRPRAAETADIANSMVQSKPDMPKQASITFVGDIMLSRGVAAMMKKRNNSSYPFLKLEDYIKSSDLAFANLETPITAGREIVSYEMLFRSDPGAEKTLKNSGFSVLSLANNHTENFGTAGLKDTFKYLNAAGIAYTGAGDNIDEANSPLYLESKGIKFALLAYADPLFTPQYYEAGKTLPGVALMRIGKMTAAVKEAKSKADIVIVSMHAGIEYQNMPDSFQINFAHAAVDAGADLIIGHHPHVIQSLEKYKGKYIFYSLGNFVFDQMFSDATREGLGVKVSFDGSLVSGVELVPIWMENLAQPRVADVAKYNLVLDRLNYDVEGDRVLSVYKDSAIRNK